MGREETVEKGLGTLKSPRVHSPATRLPPGLAITTLSASHGSRERRRLRGRGRSQYCGVLTVTLPSSAWVPASKMAAVAAVAGVVGRAGWRLLQLRCLPGEEAIEPGRGEGRGRGVRPVRGGAGRKKLILAAPRKVR